MENQNSKEVNYTVREFQKTKEDAKLLAECYTSWDDPESWPGGFAHGEELTAERILEQAEMENPLSKMVVEADGKIVGHCDVKPHFKEDDTVYVGLLGVSPAYQGRGIGKNLLLRALERAKKFDKERITLHTWGGNLKAVPLYKKTGYFWAPESSVYMENFLPGILTREIFRKYFDKFGWYQTLERSLDLRPDEQTIEGMNVYRYLFKGDEDNALEILIDQKAKKICGFELNNDGQRLGATCRVKNHRAYVGYSKTPVIWTFRNQTAHTVRFALSVKTTAHIELKEYPKPLYKLEPGETKVIERQAKLKEDVTPTQTPEDPHERAKPRITSHLIMNGEKIDLTVGMVPLDPLEVEIFPMDRSIIPGETTTIPLRIWNKTREQINGTLLLSDVSNGKFEPSSFQVNLQPKERQTLEVTLSTDTRLGRKQTLPIYLHFYQKETDTPMKVSQNPIFVPIIDTPVGGGNACSGYIVEGKKAVLENRNIRLEFILEPPYFLHSLIDKRSNQKFQIDNIAPDLGYPFEGSNGELARKKQQVNLHYEKKGVSLILSTTSQKRKGLEVQRKFTLRPNSDFTEVNVTLTNHSSHAHESVGWRYFGEHWGGVTTEGLNYLPLERGILRVKNPLDFSQTVHYPRDAQKWRESWTCFEFPDEKLFGLLWDPKHVEKVRFQPLDVSSLQCSFDKIAPGAKEKVTFYLYLGRGSWKDFRTYWRQIIQQKSAVNVPPTHPDVVKEVSLDTESSSFGSANAVNIQPIALNDRLKVVIRNNTLRKLNGEFIFQLPEELSFSDDHRNAKEEFEEFTYGSPLTKTFQLQASEDCKGTIQKGRIKVVTESSTFDFSLLLAILAEDPAIQIGTDSLEEGKDQVQINNGILSFTSSKDHQGSITSLTLSSRSKQDFLQSSWPKVKPFLWYSHWYGGIAPVIRNPYGWGRITRHESFERELIERGKKKGVKYSSTLKSKEQYDGLRMEIEYLTLPSSNMLEATTRLVNLTEGHITFRGGVQAYPAVGESVENDMYFKYNDEFMKKTHYSNFHVKKENDKWVVFADDESKVGMLVLGPKNEEVPLHISDQGALANSINTVSKIRVPPQETKEHTLFFVLSSLPSLFSILPDRSSKTLKG